MSQEAMVFLVSGIIPVKLSVQVGVFMWSNEWEAATEHTLSDFIMLLILFFFFLLKSGIIMILIKYCPYFHYSSYHILYNNKINARVLIGQLAMVYCAGKPMEKSHVFRIII